MANEITQWNAPQPCRYAAGQVLRFTRGGHRGTEVAVDGHATFWDHHTETWEVVLNLHCPDDPKRHGLYFIRDSENAVAQWTEVVR